eukprot:m.236825 g.236825  ORF g.236825 m.236825 type:complete len:1264 (+) comp15265_c0_seq2:330-4121(+)
MSRAFRLYRDEPRGVVYLQNRSSGRCLCFSKNGSSVTQLLGRTFASILADNPQMPHSDVYGCLGMTTIPAPPTQDMGGVASAHGSDVKALVVISECKSNGRLFPSLNVVHISVVDIVVLSSFTVPERVSTHCSNIKKLFASGYFYFTLPSSTSRLDTSDSSEALSVAGQEDASFDDAAQPTTSSPTRVPLARSMSGSSVTSTTSSTAASFPSATQPLPMPYHLTTNLQRLYQEFEGSATPSHSFWWSRIMWEEVEKHGIDCTAWLTPIIRGSVEIRTVYVGRVQARLGLISRMSCNGAGTRVNARGLDDEGNAANFVETEQLIVFDNQVLSYVFTRGSVPVFWEQARVNVSRRVNILRDFNATQPSFERHVESLTREYGDQTYVSLLGLKVHEYHLQTQYKKHLHALGLQQSFFHFDVNKLCKGSKHKAAKLRPYVTELLPILVDHSFFQATESRVSARQRGGFRVNCFNCLARTNVCQSILGLYVLDQQIESLRPYANFRDAKSEQFRSFFVEMWQRNGDHLARCVTGAGTSSGGVRRGIVKNVQRTISRTVRMNFLDQSTQASIDIILGKYVEATADQFFVLDPVLQAELTRQLEARSDEFSSPIPITMAVGTWNVNAKKPVSARLDLHKWLLGTVQGERNPDFVAVGLQEMVDLKAQNMTMRDSSQQKLWSDKLKSDLGADEYTLVMSQQLVGICLFLFARSDHSAHVRDVKYSIVKTGAKGAVGNKGAVAIRLKFYGTTLCFVCAHLAAGKSHIEDRNRDYREITSKLNFGRGRTLGSHDYVLWFGDFNYRIELANDKCREWCGLEMWDKLRDYDQLSIQKSQGHVFQGFQEGLLDFCPTYKFDPGTRTFDTSEKQRVPSWTDRVLVKGDHVKIVHYNRNDELLMSDHRPVLAFMELQGRIVDSQIQYKVREEIMATLRKRLSTVRVQFDAEGEPINLELLSEELAELGRVCMVDQVEADIVLVTFASRSAAIRATTISKLESLCLPVHISKVQSEDGTSVGSVDSESVELDSIQTGSMGTDTDTDSFASGRSRDADGELEMEDELEDEEEDEDWQAGLLELNDDGDSLGTSIDHRRTITAAGASGTDCDWRQTLTYTDTDTDAPDMLPVRATNPTRTKPPRPMPPARPPRPTLSSTQLVPQATATVTHDDASAELSDRTDQEVPVPMRTESKGKQLKHRLTMERFAPPPPATTPTSEPVVADQSEADMGSDAGHANDSSVEEETEQDTTVQAVEEGVAPVPKPRRRRKFSAQDSMSHA